MTIVETKNGWFVADVPSSAALRMLLAACAKMRDCEESDDPLNPTAIRSVHRAAMAVFDTQIIGEALITLIDPQGAQAARSGPPAAPPEGYAPAPPAGPENAAWAPGQPPQHKARTMKEIGKPDEPEGYSRPELKRRMDPRVFSAFEEWMRGQSGYIVPGTETLAYFADDVRRYFENTAGR